MKNIIAKLAEIESKYAEERGKKYKAYLKQKYPDGIKGKVSKIFLTRGKRRNSFYNYIFDGYKPAGEVFSISQKIYEVVYQTRLCTADEVFLLSFFDEQKDLQGKYIILKDFNCIGHLFHRFVPLKNLIAGKQTLQTDFELYPTEVEILE